MTIRWIPSRVRRLAIWLLTALGLLLILKFTVMAPPLVTAVTVERRDLTSQVYGNGTVEAKIVIGVSSKVTGRIEILYADQADKVKTGQILAKLEDEDFRQQVLETQAEMRKSEANLAAEEANSQKARASLELAEKNYHRADDLVNRDLVAQQELDEQVAALEVAKRELERSEAAVDAASKSRLAAQAALAFAETKSSDMLVRAPQDGVIISRDLEQGATVTPGLPIFRMADPTILWVNANVDEAKRKTLAEGQEAVIYLRSMPQEKLRGRVARIGLESDRVTEEIEVDVIFDPPLSSFRIGEQAEVYIVTGTRTNAHALPAAAVVSKGKQRAVWLINDGKLHRQEIVVGMEDRAGFVEVLSGIDDQSPVAVAAPGEMVNFKDGKRVRINP